MTPKEKKVIFTLIAIMVIILIVVICVKTFGKGGTNTNDTNTVINNSSTNATVENTEKYITELNDGTKLNNSQDLKKSKTYKTVEISDIQITSNNGTTTILANVKNTGTAEFAREEVTLSLLDENSEVITTIPAIIPKTAPGETTQINSIVTADIANMKDFTIAAR